MRTARSVMATAVILGLAVLPLTLAAQQRQEPEAVVKAALLFLRDTYSLQKMVLDSETFVPSGRVEEIASAVGALRANGKSMLQCERESVRGQRCLFNADVDGIVSVNDSPRIRGRAATLDVVLTSRQSKNPSLAQAAVLRISLTSDSAGAWRGTDVQVITTP